MLIICVFSVKNMYFFSFDLQFCFLFKDSGAFLERRFAGLTRVEIQCKTENSYYNLTNYEWGYKVKHPVVKVKHNLF